MPALRSRPAARRHLAWLLWLALLVPLAQGTAAFHALSHAGADLADAAHGKAAHSAGPCELCLAAAAVGGGALVTAPTGVAMPAVRHASPPPPRFGVAPATPTRAYRSRAPPSASH